MTRPAARPYVWMLCGSFSFTLMVELAHHLTQVSGRCDWQTVAVFRAGLVAIIAGVMARVAGAKLVFWPWRLWVRSLAGSLSMVCTFYSFAKLNQYTFKQRLIIRLAGLLLYWLIRAIGATMKFEVVGWEHHTEDEPLIYCFWHNRIPTATYFWRRRGIVVMSSQSFDSRACRSSP